MSARTATVLGAAVLLLVAAAVGVLLLPWGDDEPAPVRTVFIGDSITQGDSTGVDTRPGPGSWVRYAVEDARSPWAFEANVAIAGQTLAQMEERFQRDVLARSPQGVVIMGGTNDVLRGLPPEVAVESLRAMVEAARDAGAEVWVIGPPPIDAAYLKPVGPMAAAEEQAAGETGATYVPVGEGLTGPTGDWLPGLSWDGVHPTPEGARALADAVLDQLG